MLGEPITPLFSTSFHLSPTKTSLRYVGDILEDDHFISGPSELRNTFPFVMPADERSFSWLL
jgi:hypothetical protein